MFMHAEPGTEKLEYKVRKVTRYIVTEWHSYGSQGSVTGGLCGGSSSYGEFESASEAYKVATALASHALREHGWQEGGGRLTFPTDELVAEQAEEYRRYHEDNGPKPTDL